MPRKKPSMANKVAVIFQEGEEELGGELFDINAGKGLVKIKINRLVPNPNQPRKTFYEQTISELAESIKEHGVLSPILVRPLGDKYQIIAGERRFKASRQAGLKEMPALIRKVSNGDARIISLIENIQREDLNDIDRASALRELKVNLGLPWEKLGKKLGLTKSRILDLVGLLDLPEEIKNDIRHKKLTEKHGRALRLLLDRAEVLRDVFQFMKVKKLSGDESLGLVRLVKSQPRLTIEEAYNQGKSEPKKEKTKDNLIEVAIDECARLARTIEKINIEEVTGNNKKSLQENLLRIQKKIEMILNFMNR